MIQFFITLVVFCLFVSILVKLPMLAEFKQVIVVIALLIILLYTGQFFGVLHGHQF